MTNPLTVDDKIFLEIAQLKTKLANEIKGSRKEYKRGQKYKQQRDTLQKENDLLKKDVANWQDLHAEVEERSDIRHVHMRQVEEEVKYLKNMIKNYD